MARDYGYGITLRRKAKLTMTNCDSYVDLVYQVVTPDGMCPIAYFSPNRWDQVLTNEFVRYLRRIYAPITADEVEQAFVPDEGAKPWDVVEDALKRAGGKVHFPWKVETFPHYVLRVSPPTRAVVRAAHRAALTWLRDGLMRCEGLAAQRNDFQSWLREDWTIEV